MSKKIGEVGSDLSQAGTKDAFHVPAILLIADRVWRPGDWCYVHAEGKTTAPTGEVRGIIDPFLKRPTVGGDLVWVLMDPSLVDKFYHAFDVKGLSPDIGEIKRLKDEILELKGELSNWEDDSCSGCYS